MLPRSVTVRKYLLTVTLFPCSKGVTVTKDVLSEQTNVTLASFVTQGECQLMTRSRETELFNETHCMKPELSELERKSTKSNAICSTKQNDLRGPFALYSPSFALSLLSLSSGWGREKERKRKQSRISVWMKEVWQKWKAKSVTKTCKPFWPLEQHFLFLLRLPPRVSNIGREKKAFCVCFFCPVNPSRSFANVLCFLPSCVHLSQVIRLEEPPSKKLGL